MPEIKNRIIGSGEEPLDGILFNPRNWRVHPLNQQNALRGVLEEVGWVQEVIINKRTGHLVDGHLRCQLAAREGAKTIPVKYVDLSEEEEALVLATIDPIAAMAVTDKAKLDDLFRDIQSDNEDVQKLMGEIAAREGIINQDNIITEAHKTLAERFIVPPFSVLDARQGYWQDRKRRWIELGIQSEIGRGEHFSFPDDHIGDDGKFHTGDLHLGDRRDEEGKTIRPSTLGAVAPNEKGENGILTRTGKYATNGLLGFSEQSRTHYNGKEAATSNSSQDRLRALQKTGDSRAVVYGTEGNVSEQSGTSIFDPVLCELAYRWFMPSGGSVLDPFAGGSVRGIVACLLGHDYTGIDLSKRQIEANIVQGKQITPNKQPKWIIGDSNNVTDLALGEYDFIFSCPPYADLEVYSDDPNDLSTMDYLEFKTAYHEIISKSVSMLKENRFACFIVGDVRDKKGYYRNFVSNTIDAFQDAGMKLYNEAILITAVGSLPIRAGRAFSAGRKLGKTHQNVLVFYKGDVGKIREFGDVECGEVEQV